MKISITVLIGIPSPHQIPLGRALYSRLGGDFRMIFTQPMDKERSKMGWKDARPHGDWIIKAWESDAAHQLMKKLVRDSDVVIYGLVPIDLVRDRILARKLTLRLSERLFKRGVLLGFPWWFKRLCCDFWPLNKHNHHLLCAGAYCSFDHRKVGMFKGRMWVSGYFTETAEAPPPARSYESVAMLWAGRMLALKRVDLIINAAARLRSHSSVFTLDLVGDGPEKNRLMNLRDRLGLQNTVKFLPFMPVAKVRQAMRKANIYLMPSNFQEGWGAVINEAMSEGCCVVSSTGPGAAPWLIEHGKTGYLFPSGNLDALCDVLTPLLDHPSRCREIA